MVYISFNITTETESLNLKPFLDYYDSFKTFSNLLRDWCSDYVFVEWASHHYKNNKKISLCLSIIEEMDDKMVYCREFKINLRNIREYKKWLSLSQEEVDNLIISMKREEKISEII
jgi:hypothetical protein